MENNIDGKIEIKRNREDLYILQVNEKGDTIEFDLTDIRLPERIMNAVNEIKKVNDKYRKDILDIEKEDITDVEKTKKIIEIDKKNAIASRKLFDSFLGENACQKIFGDRNYYGMYAELIEKLEPHFDKMIINSQKAKMRLVEKYKPKEKDVM